MGASQRMVCSQDEMEDMEGLRLLFMGEGARREGFRWGG